MIALPWTAIALGENSTDCFFCGPHHDVSQHDTAVRKMLEESGWKKTQMCERVTLKGLNAMPLSVCVKTYKRWGRAERELRHLIKLADTSVAPRPCCLQVLEGKDEDSWFIVMEWVEGKDLSEDEITPDLVRAIRQAINKLHAQNVVHNDIKPEHIKIQKDGQIRIIDFDLATNLLGATRRVNARYTDEHHEINSPNSQHPAGFNGTIRYAPIDAHLGRWTKPFCDIESLYYVIRHLVKADLPWFSVGGDVNEQVRDAGFEKIREVYAKNPVLWRVFEVQKHTGNGEVPDDLFDRLFASLFASEIPTEEGEEVAGNKPVESPKRAAAMNPKDSDANLDSLNACAPPKPSSVATVNNTSGGGAASLDRSAEDIVRGLFEPKKVTWSNRTQTACVAVTPEDYAYSFRKGKCETGVYLTQSPDFHLTLSEVAVENDIHLRALAEVDRLFIQDGKQDAVKVIGEIGVSSCRPPLANLSNEVLTRNRNSAALAREVGDRHPLMIAKFVKDSVVFFCSRKSEELLEGFLDQHVIPRFLAELLMFPVDHVLVALGRYRVVGVGGRDLTFVESIADSMASENGERESELLEREESVAQREKAVFWREQAAMERESRLTERERQLTERERQLTARERRLAEQEDRLAAQESRLEGWRAGGLRECESASA